MIDDRNVKLAPLGARSGITGMPNANGDNLCFVLVGTTHPGNIGAAARAMKSMGMRRLALVQPKHFPCAEATAMASEPMTYLPRPKSGVPWRMPCATVLRSLPPVRVSGTLTGL